MLERQGYQIAVASNGTLGIAKAASERPDLILLDVMMPDLDGYEVTRQLRSELALASIPIIMFTAKTMVDDKVAGFEAGVDDYLTKPTHPAELTAHVKAVLARSAQTRALPTDRAKVIGLIGARGGVGTSTLALNIGVRLSQTGHDVIVSEINPGRGSMALDLDQPDSNGLSNLLGRSLKDIHLRSVESELVAHKSGVRFLFSSHRPRESDLDQAVPQLEAVTTNLATMCTLLILDLGAGLHRYTLPLLEQCDRILLVTEPVYPSNEIARGLLDEIISGGIARQRINLVLVTRERTSLQIPWQQVEGDLGIELAGIVSPAPEQAHQASQSGTPIIAVQRESLVTDQLRKLAEHLEVHL
jgi:CheY-like chemotaxis protein